MPDPKNNKKELPKKVNPTLADNLKMVLEKHKRQNNQPVQENSKILDSKFKKQNIPEKVETPMNMESPLYAKLTAKCKAAARRKFDVYPSAYANIWASKQQKKGKC
jgi:hypothetical protein